MKVNLGDKPPMLHFFDGDDRIDIQLKRFTGTDRMAVLDAAGLNSFEQVQMATERLVVGWDNVKDENGRAIPLESEDGKGNKVRNIDKVLGCMTLLQQMEIILGIVGFVGVPKQDLRGMLDKLKKLVDEEVDLDPTPPPDGDTPPPASDDLST